MASKKKQKTGKLSLPPSSEAAVSQNRHSEDIEKNALNAILAKANSNTANTTSLGKTKGSKPLAEDNAVKKALAEISFIEAGETLEKGDLQNAIAKYKEAINYFSDNPDYYLKLVDAFQKDTKYKSELDSCLKDLAKKFPDNNEIKAKIENLNPVKKDTKNYSKIIENSKKQNSFPARELENKKQTEFNKTSNSNSNSTPSVNTKTNAKTNAKIKAKDNTKSPINEKTNENDTKSKAPKMLKLRNNVYVLTEGVKKQNPYVKAISILILILLPLGIFWGLNRSYKETIIETSPISPDAQSKLTQNQLYFCWNSNSDKVDYLFQIEQDGKPVLERYTKEKFYLVSQEDSTFLKKNTYSTWRAVPLSPKRDQLNYKASEGQFMLVEERKNKEN